MKGDEMHKIIQEESATISHDTKGCKNIDLEMGNLNTQICTFNTQQFFLTFLCLCRL